MERASAFDPSTGPWGSLFHRAEAQGRDPWASRFFAKYVDLTFDGRIVVFVGSIDACMDWLDDKTTDEDGALRDGIVFRNIEPLTQLNFPWVMGALEESKAKGLRATGRHFAMRPLRAILAELADDPAERRRALLDSARCAVGAAGVMLRAGPDHRASGVALLHRAADYRRAAVEASEGI